MKERTNPNPEYIRNLFGSIAGTYDKANDVITFGLAHSWRRKVVELSQAQEGDHVLDCATGTGDLAIEFKKAVGAKGRVLGTDFCQEMLDFAPEKAKKEKLEITFELADATNLQYEDNQFDVVSIAYGIRNVSDPIKALQEMARVTKPGGYVMVLETGETRAPLLNSMINIYFKHLVPRLGGWVSGRRDAYEYLNKSSDKFPCKQNFIELMNESGVFSKSEYTSLMGGASYIYKGTKKYLS